MSGNPLRNSSKILSAGAIEPDRVKLWDLAFVARVHQKQVATDVIAQINIIITCLAFPNHNHLMGFHPPPQPRLLKDVANLNTSHSISHKQK